MHQSEIMFTMDNVSKPDIMEISENKEKIDEVDNEWRQRNELVNGDYDDLISEVSDNNEEYVIVEDKEKLINMTRQEELGEDIENPIIVEDNDNKEDMNDLISGSEPEDSDIERETEGITEEIIITDVEEEQSKVEKDKLHGTNRIENEITPKENDEAKNDEAENNDTNNNNSREENESLLNRGSFDISDDDIENLEELEHVNYEVNRKNTDIIVDKVSKNIKNNKENLISETNLSQTNEHGSFPIILQIYDTEFLLVPFEGESNLDLSHLVELYDDNKVLKLSIEGFFNSIRKNEDICECFKLEDNQELVLTVPDLNNLCIVEDNLYAKDIIIQDFILAFNNVAMYTKNKNLIPSQMTLILSSQKRFITEFNHISQTIRSKYGFESIKSPTITRSEKHFLHGEENEEHIGKKQKKSQ